jgi:acetolactate synthase-1/2/3 large subunit
MRGADLVAQSLKRSGTKTIFALSGNQIMPIFDACIDVEITLHHVRHEAATTYMADCWAQLTGKVGVALVTAAPGFANALSPLYSAHLAESPVVLLSGDSPIAADGSGAFQELDQTSASRPFTKLSFRSQRAADLGKDIARAIRVAQSGRPGPVHLALPFDLLNADTDNASLPELGSFLPEHPLTGPKLVDALASAIADAKTPLVLTGPRLSATRSKGLLEKLADALDAPVISMESPRGLNDPSIGDFAQQVPNADLIVSLGKRFDFTTGFGKPPAMNENAQFIVVDAEENELERARRALGPRLIATHFADPATTAELLAATGKAGSTRTTWRTDVASAIAARPTEPSNTVRPMRPVTLCAEIQKVINAADDPILVVDGGEFGQWAQACLSAPTRVINGPGGAIGGGLCYAFAAKIARPEATVIALMGDGTAGFHFAEFETASRYGTNFIAVIGNDAKWNAEYQIQLRDYGEQRLYGCELNPTRYDQAAQGLGCHGEHVMDPAALSEALKRAQASELPACINVEIEGLPAPSGSGH